MSTWAPHACDAVGLAHNQMVSSLPCPFYRAPIVSDSAWAVRARRLLCSVIKGPERPLAVPVPACPLQCRSLQRQRHITHSTHRDCQCRSNVHFRCEARSGCGRVHVEKLPMCAKCVPRWPTRANSAPPCCFSCIRHSMSSCSGCRATLCSSRHTSVLLFGSTISAKSAAASLMFIV
jgi:hypothetical protein